MKGLTEPERLAAEVRSGEITREVAIRVLMARRRLVRRDAEPLLDNPPGRAADQDGRVRRARHR